MISPRPNPSIILSWKIFFTIWLCVWSAPTLAQWKYIKQIDKFTGKDESHIRLKSKNSQAVGLNSRATSAEIIIFESPDSTSFKAALMFSQHSWPVAFNYQSDICVGSYDCKVLVKIDNGEILKIPIIESGQGDKAFVYLRVPNDKIIKGLLEAKKIEMRVAFYKNGDGDFMFISNGKNALVK
jgi:hypothetical protein